MKLEFNFNSFIMEKPETNKAIYRNKIKYRNQSTDLQSKSMDWYLYDRDHRHERVNRK